MQGIVKAERGAALVTVMLFMILTFIMISTMLATSRNEVVISRLHRDGVRSMELAQAGIQEAVARIQAGRPYAQGFTSSLNPGVTVAVVRRVVGTGSAYLELQATATTGGATRRLSSLVLQQMNQFPPNIMWGPSVASEGEDIRAGDVYAQTYVHYNTPGKPLFNPASTWTYAGWRISEPPLGLGPCHTHADCVAGGNPETVNWYPATRRSENASSLTGADILAQTKKCAAGGGGLLPPTTITGVLAADPCTLSCTTVTVNTYGFDTDNPGTGPLAVTTALPCGLPYKYVSQTFTDETGGSQTRLFKTIVFEQSFTNYWTFDPAQMTFLKTPSLVTNPQFGAIPPAPIITTDPSNFDRFLTGGGTVTGDLGTCSLTTTTPPCTEATDRPISVLLNGGTWTLNGPTFGHGTIVVNGNLIINGDIQYYGTMIVNGTFDAGTAGGGPRDIFGGVLTTQPPLAIHRSLHVTGGGIVVPVGRSVVIGKAWWER